MTKPDSPSQSNSAPFVCIVLALIVVGAVFLTWKALGPAPRSGGAAAIGGLKAISNAQILYREGDKDGDGTLSYAASLEALTNTGTSGREDLIDRVLASGTKQGYVYAITSSSEFGWTANADPVEPGVTGDRYFGANMEGRIFFSTTERVRWNPDGSSPDRELGR